MTQPAPARSGGLRLGLRANLAQFSLLVGVNALVGGMVGQERSLLSLLATQAQAVGLLRPVSSQGRTAGLCAFSSTRRPESG
jgi:hypothetical protein